jgi:excisionase family DNA binding protein
MTSELLDIEEAANFLHVKPCTVRSWVLKSRVVYVKLGRRIFLRKPDLEQLIADSVVRPKKSQGR